MAFRTGLRVNSSSGGCDANAGLTSDSLAEPRCWRPPGGALTIEVDGADVSQQLPAIDVGHPGARAGVTGAQLAVHVVQRVGHGVHGVHDELDLPLLLVGGVTADLLQP